VSGESDGQCRVRVYNEKSRHFIYLNIIIIKAAVKKMLKCLDLLLNEKQNADNNH